MRLVRIRRARNLLLGLVLLLFLAACGPSGSSEPDPTPTPTPTPPVVITYALTGTVFTPTGAPLANKTGVAYVFSSTYQLDTDSSGQFKVQTMSGQHAVLVSAPQLGYSDFLRWVDFSGGALELFLPLAGFTGESQTAPANAQVTVVSNSLATGAGVPYTASVTVPVQAGGSYTVNGKLVNSARISLENIDLHGTLPFPLPDIANRTAGLNPTVERQAPVLAVNVGPSLLGNLNPGAVLTLPNPYNTGGLQVLHFNTDAHQWEVVINPNTLNPYTLAEAVNGMLITQGGFYGVFAEDRSHLGDASGTIDMPAGSLVFLGDQVQILTKDNGTVFFSDIHVPYDGKSLVVTVLDPNTSPPTVTTTTVAMAQGVNNYIRPIGGEVGSVTLSVDSTLVADGVSTTTVSAVVLDKTGQPVRDGIDVAFSLSPTDVADLSAATAKTQDSEGKASVTLTSRTKLGSVQISASCQGINAAAATVSLIAGPPANVVVTGDKQTIVADGTSTATFTAVAKDAQDHTVADGTAVTWAAYYNTGADYNEISPVNTTTSDGGRAVTTLTALSAAQPGWYTVVATSGSIAGQAFIQFFDAEVGSVSVSAGGATQIVADGQSKLSLAILVLNDQGNPMRDGTVVAVETTAGTLNLPAGQGGADTYTTTVSGGNGQARVDLYSGTNPALATVTATSGGRNGSLNVNFVAGPADKIQVTAAPTSLTADGASTSNITVLVLDANDNPVADGNVVTFSLPVGAGQLSAISGTTNGGLVEATYTAPSSVPAQNPVVIQARVGNATPGSVAITLNGPQVAGIVLSASPTTLPADGKSTSSLSATVTVAGGGDAPDGLVVSFSIVGSGSGTITPSATTSSGVAVATLTSGTKTEIVTVRAEAGGRRAETQVEYKPGNVSVNVIPNTVLGTGKQTAKVTVLVTQADDSPVPYTNVNFTLSDDDMGAVAPSTVVTNAAGYSETTLYAGKIGGTLTVTGTWSMADGTSVTGSGAIDIQPPPAVIQLSGSPDPSAINVRGQGGTTTSVLTFAVKDAQNQNVADGYRINFAIQTGPNGGESIVPAYALTSNGLVSTTLRSGFKSGPVSVKATYNDDTNVTATSSAVSISNGPPVGEAFGISSDFLNVAGLNDVNNLLDVLISTSAGDVDGQAVPDSTSISFKTYNTGGLFPVPASSGTVNGLASKMLVSSLPDPIGGFVSVTAEATNGGRTTKITSLSVDQRSRNVVYAGTNGGGVYKSTDGGASWQSVSRSTSQPGQNWLGAYVNDVAVDPNHEDTVFAATGYGGSGKLYRSFDAGANWNSDNIKQVFGAFESEVAVSCLALDNDVATDWMWLGTNGKGVYYTDDRAKTATAVSAGLSFTQAAGLGNGRVVKDLVRSPNTHGAGARLYAATSTGLWWSIDGGVNWSEFAPAIPSGGNIQSLSIYNPGAAAANDIIYAGTAEAGVWVWTNAGGWLNYTDGLGGGVRATKPVLASGATGNGTIASVAVGSDTLTESWTLSCVSTGPAVFTVSGSVSGLQAAQATAGTPYASDNAEVSFTIVKGEKAFAVGDKFTFNTFRDPGNNIRCLLLDIFNWKLYAVTYFYGALEPHPVGNVYVHDLYPGGAMYTGAPVVPGLDADWRTANTGLPQFDPPDDQTLFAQNVLAFDNPAGPTYILTGGEGIHCYKAASFVGTTSFSTGNLDWHASESGLTNLIMARMPILFSGTSEIRGLAQTISTTPGGITYYDYSWYVEDENGNPPVAGSTMEIVYYDSAGGVVETLMLQRYGDVQRERGTWRDRNDKSTDRPFRSAFSFGGSYAYAALVFTPTCDATSPGCSGEAQAIYLPLSPGYITLMASKNSIVADGVSTTILTAWVQDDEGANAPDGTEVKFFADAGTPLTATATTVDGKASFTLTSSTVAGPATIYATSGDVSSEELTVQFTPGVSSTVTVTATPSTISGDGASQSRLRAVATDSHGNAVADGTLITFSEKLQPGGATTVLGQVATLTGIADYTYTASQTFGTYLITASAPNAVSGTTNLILTPETAADLSLTTASGSKNPQIVANGASYVTLEAYVINAAGIPLKDGSVVTFTTTGGYFNSAGGPTTTTASTTNGKARVDLYSPTKTGDGNVTASIQGVSDALTAAFIPGPVFEIQVTANPQSLQADGSSTSEINITVLDANGNPVADNSTTLTLSVPPDQGRISPLTVKPVGGVAQATYTTPATVPSGRLGNITVTATNLVTGKVSITLSGPIIGGITLSADPATLPRDGKSTSTIFAEVTLQGGGPAPDGTEVNFSIKPGTGEGASLSATTANTGGGFAITTLTSSDTAESATIVATAGGRNQELSVAFTPGAVTVSVVPNTVLGTGNKTAAVTALVVNAEGKEVTNVTVTFSLSDESAGTLNPRQAITSALPGSEGVATTTFYAGTKGGDVDITGTWDTGSEDVSGKATITVQPPPASIEIADLGTTPNPNPASISIKGTGGQSTSTIVFDVKDGESNNVADGYRINFTLETGPDGGESIIPAYAYTKDGRVSTILRSGLKSGTVTIRATYFNDTSVTTATNQVAIDNGPPVGENFGLFAGYFNISGLRNANLQDPVSVTVADIYGQAIPNNTAISFKTYNTGGSFPVPASAPTTDGVATSTLRSGGQVPNQGFLSVTCEANNGGRTTHVTSIATLPALYDPNHQIMFAGTNGGGVYRSTNGGASWTTVSRSSTIAGQNWINPYVNDVVVDPDNPSMVFAATGYGGAGALYRSFDGGSTWNSDNVEEVYGALDLLSGATTVLCDDGSDYMWVGSYGQGLFYTTDNTRTPTSATLGMTFAQASSGLVAGRSVTDIVKVPGSGNGLNAQLYAGSLSGVWKSVVGTADWNRVLKANGTNLPLPSVTNLEVYDNGANDVIYAGTEADGVWVHDGADWTNWTDGLGGGVRATTPILSTYSSGNGTMSKVTVATDTVTEAWDVVCVQEVAGGGVFAVTGTVSGPQPFTATCGTAYNSTTGGISFTITAGEVDFKLGDTFSFDTIRDPGRGIVDLLVDTVNMNLYAVTYFWGTSEPHAVGNVYVRKLDANGLPTVGEPWKTANKSLPQFDPPDDLTLFAQHVLAFDDPAAPTAIFAGGEGIHLYKATNNLGGTVIADGNLNWQQSEFGLTNLIMAREPFLFSGTPSFIYAAGYPFSNPADCSGGACTVYYQWYVEDVNGNPPISGSQMRIITYKINDKGQYEQLDDTLLYGYGDDTRAIGTWYDKQDIGTRYPFSTSVAFNVPGGGVAKVELKFVPYCAALDNEGNLPVPGCSGSDIIITSLPPNF